MPSQWYRNESGHDSGPFTFEELVAQVRSGALTGEDLVRRSEEKRWQRVEEVVGLMRAARISGNSTSPVRRPASAARSAAERTPEEHAPEREASARWWREPLTRDQLYRRALPGTVLAIALVFGLSWWWTRPPRPPQVPAARMEVVIPSRIEQMRPRRPKSPTISGLPDDEPAPVPGLENVRWATGPTLSADLKTIVYVTYRGAETQDDLIISERDSPEASFRSPVPIGTCAGPNKESYPTLSHDGLELIYSELGKPNRLMISQRSSRQDEFPSPKPLVIEGADFSALHVDGGQFLSPTRIRFATSDQSFTERTQWVAERDAPTSAFRIVGKLPFSNPWPRYFVTPNQQRAYYPSEDGVFLTALETSIGEFVIPERLVSAEVMGPNPSRFDSPLWIAPNEDLVVFCSAGKEQPDSKDNRLWMLSLGATGISAPRSVPKNSR